MPTIILVAKNVSQEIADIREADKECGPEMRRIERLNRDLGDGQLFRLIENYNLSRSSENELQEAIDWLVDLEDHDFEFEGDLGLQWAREHFGNLVCAVGAAKAMRRDHKDAESHMERSEKMAEYQKKNLFAAKIKHRGPVGPSGSLSDRAERQHRERELEVITNLPSK
jgi:hypothetical protein